MVEEEIKALMSGFQEAFKQSAGSCISGFSEICRFKIDGKEERLEDGLVHLKEALAALVLAVECLEAMQRILDD